MLSLSFMSRIDRFGPVPARGDVRCSSLRGVVFRDSSYNLPVRITPAHHLRTNALKTRVVHVSHFVSLAHKVGEYLVLFHVGMVGVSVAAGSANLVARFTRGIFKRDVLPRRPGPSVFWLAAATICRLIH